MIKKSDYEEYLDKQDLNTEKNQTNSEVCNYGYI